MIILLNGGCSVSVQALAHLCMLLTLLLRQVCPFLCPGFVVEFHLWGLFQFVFCINLLQAMSPPQPGHLSNFDWINSNKQDTLFLLVS